MTTLASCQPTIEPAVSLAGGSRRPRGLAMPDDLRHWHGEPLLVRFALQAATEVGLPGGSGQPTTPESTPFTPAALLTLLTYGYATGRFGSEDLETAATDDATLRYLAGRPFPPATALRRFRRHHRHLIERALSRVLAHCWSAAVTNVDRPAAVPQARPDAPPAPEPTCALELMNEEARGRIERAILEDSVAADW